MNNDSKAELKLWLIIGLLLGVFIWQMPNIERLIFGRAKREKAEPKKEEKVEVKSGKITCGGTTDSNSSIEYVIYHESNKATKVVVTETTIYESLNESYNSNKEKCNNLVKYNDKSGYKVTCNIDNLKIETKETFDLKTFKEFNMTNNGSDMTKTIPVKYNQSIKEVTNTFKDLGTTCK